jgi:hypothetical protein
MIKAVGYIFIYHVIIVDFAENALSVLNILALYKLYLTYPLMTFHVRWCPWTSGLEPLHRINWVNMFQHC